MNMPYPPHAVYRKLYARYFKGDRTEKMVALAGDLSGKVVLDLCGGGGRLSAVALAAGAKVTLVDDSNDMSETVPPGITRACRRAQSWLSSFCANDEYDVVFCQQAVNYWLDEDSAAHLGATIKPGGLFIFNTFNRKPTGVPVVKQYEHEGANFVEVSWLTGEATVQHLQIREGAPAHSTQFKWISEEQFRELLSPHFSLCEIRDGATSVWFCTRKK